MTNTPAPEKPINPTVRALLEYGPLAILLAGFLLYRNETVRIAGQEWQGLVAATAFFIPAQILSTLVMWRLSGRLQAMQVITLVLVVGLGGVTLWLNDPAFIKMKPTFLYLLIAAALSAGMFLQKNWLSLAFGQAIQLSTTGWRILTWRFVILCVVLAASNEIVWRSMSESFWMGFKLMFLPISMVAFMLLNYKLFQQHSINSDDT